MARLRPAREREKGWAVQLLQWRKFEEGRWQADIAAARYFVVGSRFETACWAEVRAIGGRRRVELGTFASVREAQQACEADAVRRLRKDGDARPVNTRIAPARRQWRLP